MLKVEENEKVISIDCAGVFDTPTGKYKVLQVVIKIERQKQ